MKFPFLEEPILPSKLTSPVNISPQLNFIICSGKATYLELQEKLSVLDMYNLLEIISVDCFNQRVWAKHSERG